MPNYLLEITPPVGVVADTIRISTKTISTSPSDTPANTVYHGALNDAGKIERELTVGDGSISPSVRFVPMEVANLDGRFDELLDLGLDGWAFTLRLLQEDNALVSTSVLILSGTLAGIDESDALRSIRLSIRDKTVDLRQPFLTATYAGTTVASGPTAEGDQEILGQLKPRVFGTVFNILPVLVNRFDLIYQVSNGPVSSITVYEGGLPLQFAGNHLNLAALQSTSVAPGFYRTCLSAGLFSVGAVPQSVVTADVSEETLTNRSASNVARRILQAFNPSLPLDLTAFSSVHTFNSSEIGIFISSADFVEALVSQVLDTIGAALITTVGGTYKPIALVAPTAAAVKTFVPRDVAEDDFSMTPRISPASNVTSPVWKVTCNYAKVWRVQTELYGAVTTTQRDFVTKEWRASTPAQNNTVKLQHPLSQELVKNTLFTQKAAADAEAIRLLDLSRVRRDNVRMTPVKYTDATARDIGDIVAFSIPRLGYDGGRKFFVIGRTDDNTRHRVSLSLWG